MTNLMIQKGLETNEMTIIKHNAFEVMCSLEGKEDKTSKENKDAFKDNEALYFIEGNLINTPDGDKILRRNDMIESHELVVLDYDKGFTRPAELVRHDLDKRGLKYILTPTPSYTADNERWRLILALDKPCPVSRYKEVVNAVAKDLKYGEHDSTSGNGTQLQGMPIVFLNNDDDDEPIKPFYKTEGKPLQLDKYLQVEHSPLEIQSDVKGKLVVDGEFEQKLLGYADRMGDKLDDDEYGGLWFNTLLSLRRTLLAERIGEKDAHNVIRVLWADNADLVRENIDKFNKLGNNIKMDKHIDEWIALNDSDIAYYERKTACESLNLDLNKKGEVLPTQQNYVRIIKDMFPQLYFDSYSQQIMNDGAIDIRRHDGEKIHYGANYYKSDSVLDKQERTALMYFAQERYGMFKLSRFELEDAFATVARENIRHRITTKLDVLEWDGNERLDEYLIKSVKAVDNTFTREVTRKTIVAMVMRAYRPGTKFELMPILVGQQGGGKSTAFRSLMYAVLGTADLYDDSLKMGDTSKDGMLSLNNAWVVEYSELRAVKGFTIEDMKALVTSDKDSYRKPYATDVTVNPRKCIMIGTTNETPQQLLNDSGGNRRWAIIECKQTRLDIKPTDVPLHDSEEGMAYLHQVMAEAVHIAKSNFETMDKGGTVDIPNRVDKLSESSIMYQTELNESLHDEPDYIEMVSLFANMTVPSKWDDWGLVEKKTHFVTVANNPKNQMDAWTDKVDAFTLQEVCKIACEGLDTKVVPQNRAGQKIGTWLLENGFERKRVVTKGVRETKYYRV